MTTGEQTFMSVKPANRVLIAGGTHEQFLEELPQMYRTFRLSLYKHKTSRMG